MTKVPHVEWVDIVDEQDRVIGVAERARVRQENLRHRASYILVLDEAERILVQRRTRKDFCPGMLDACAGGVVTTGRPWPFPPGVSWPRSWGSAMCPAGLRHLLCRRGGERQPLPGLGRPVQLSLSGPLQLQAEEVSEVHWMSLGEIADRAGEFTPTPCSPSPPGRQGACQVARNRGDKRSLPDRFVAARWTPSPSGGMG